MRKLEVNQMESLHGGIDSIPDWEGLHGLLCEIATHFIINGTLEEVQIGVATFETLGC